MSLLVRNRILECFTPGTGRKLDRRCVNQILIHRTSLSNVAPWNPSPVALCDLDGPVLAGRFASKLSPTGGCVPYHLLVTTAAKAEQLLPLRYKGAHAPGCNWRSWAVAIVGEHEPATEQQLDAAAQATARLYVLAGGASVLGHTEDAPERTRDVGKVCPEPVVEMHQFRSRVRALLPVGWETWPAAQAEEWVHAAGVVI